ncbi:MAG: hypothetical protein OJF49_004322 [Ktedonobacterales bacterium]|nr:MAG: hypothetical protein OJF49_004322 [Ktedonobacterales bacterium]
MAGVTGVKPKPRLAGPSFAVAPSHVRTLLWLRWKLTLRGYTRDWRRMVGLVFLLLFLAPTAGFVAFGTYLAYTQLSQPIATQVLFVVLVGLFFLWAALPLLQFNLNEGLDVTKLQIYPLTRGEQMLSLVLATFFDISAIFLLALLAAVLAAWHATVLATVITVVAVLAAYFNIVAFSQLILAALMGMLRSRRFRDVTIIFFALFGVTCSVGSQVLSRALAGIGENGGSVNLETTRLDQYLRWTPTGMAAQAISLAGGGSYTAALPWLAGAVLFVPLLLLAWERVLNRSITNAESAGGGNAQRRRGRGRIAGTATATTAGVAVRPAATPTTPAVAARRGRRPISGVALTIAWKDARYLWRDPQMKAALISVLFATIIILFPNLYAGRAGRVSEFSSGHATVLTASLPALLVILGFAQNSLGMERQGLQTLFLFPVRPLDIFFGKNLFVGLFAVVFQTILILIRAAMTGGWEYVIPALCLGIAADFVMLGCGNVSSVLIPFRWRQMRMGDTSSMSSENGCLRFVLSIVNMAITAIVLIPVAAAILLPLLLAHSEWLVVTLPLALVYGAAFYQVATRMIAPVMLRRAPEILATVVREA